MSESKIYSCAVDRRDILKVSTDFTLNPATDGLELEFSMRGRMRTSESVYLTIDQVRELQQQLSMTLHKYYEEKDRGE
jgi:hypothetical protein